MGKGVTPIYWGIGCAIFRVLSFGWKKIFASILYLVIKFFGQIRREHSIVFYFQSMERCIDVEWGLEQISDLSLLTNQVIKVIYSYFKSPPK